MRKILVYILCFAFATVHGQSNLNTRLAEAAQSLTESNVVYDPSYFKIPYPNGDVPANSGVCTDVVIRAYRVVGIDLQKEVHEDMERHFDLYPDHWGLKKPDPNIDHRRVPNLMTFFLRHGRSLSLDNDPLEYLPGDIVCWDLGSGILHIGVVSSRRTRDADRYMVVHNIGAGQVMEDVLFSNKIIGHYRYKG